jgi:hypothetical protein
MGIEHEITEIMSECDAVELARVLIERTRMLKPLNREDSSSLALVLEDVSRELPCHEALWMAFWLGCAWQNLRD